MLGKMYRPIKVTTLHTKRGFHFHHKYKSNFAGLYEFSKDIYLHFENGEECIMIEFHDLTIPIVLDSSIFQLTNVDEAESVDLKRKVDSLREISRPAKEQMSSSGDQLRIQMDIRSERNPIENESILIELRAVVIENKEYLRVNVIADSQVCIAVNTTVRLIEQ